MNLDIHTDESDNHSFRDLEELQWWLINIEVFRQKEDLPNSYLRLIKLGKKCLGTGSHVARQS